MNMRSAAEQEAVEGVVVTDDDEPFFAPVSYNVIDSLLEQYASDVEKMDAMIAAVGDAKYAGLLTYFVEGNCRDRRHATSGIAEELFKREGAIASLTAAYWTKAMAATDVLDYMPQARRDEWYKAINEGTTMAFSPQTVGPTIDGLLASRKQFMCERVDGAFRALSHEHVTNSPMGFYKRMILGYALDQYGYVNHRQAGYINDLRCVVAKMMGTPELKHYSTMTVIDRIKGEPGEWKSIDGGAMRIRVYKKGTAHLEVHPDIAWRLNRILSSMYPMAIPSEFRTTPIKRNKEFGTLQRPLPHGVVEMLAGASTKMVEPTDAADAPTFCVTYVYSAADKAAFAETEVVMAAIGGSKKSSREFVFDFDPTRLIKDIVVMGAMPDKKTHQFYPTPESVASVVVDMADLQQGVSVLEPSAGNGNLLDALPEELGCKVQCVELSKLRCTLLSTKGYAVDQADFLVWAAAYNGTGFDRVLMNPPFSEGRAQLHLTAASKLVKEGGRITAVLPASMRNKEVLRGWECAWSDVITNEFAGTGVSVAVITAVRK